jgi:hypothetical protein
METKKVKETKEVKEKARTPIFRFPLLPQLPLLPLLPLPPQLPFLPQPPFRYLLVFPLLLLCCTSPTACATTLARLNVDDLARASDAVARVRCTGAESRWENGSIWTVTTFGVVETWKGNLASEIAVSLPGGRAGHLTATVDGAPRFRPGEEAVVFLEKARAGGFTVAGWVEGTFRIARDPRTRVETVTQDSSAFAVFDAATRTFRAEGIRRMPLDEFRSRVAAAVARSQEKKR